MGSKLKSMRRGGAVQRPVEDAVEDFVATPFGWVRLRGYPGRTVMDGNSAAVAWLADRYEELKVEDQEASRGV